MKKKEFLIIFILAVLVTALTPLFQGVRIEYGWPLAFLWVGFPVPQKWLPLSLLVDLLFWFLVLAAGWWVIKKLKIKKFASQSSSEHEKLKICLIVFLFAGITLAAVWVAVRENQRQQPIPTSQSISLSPNPPTQVSVTPTAPVFNNTCTLEPRAGPCKAMRRKFFYDQSVRRCRPFVWGGCDGVVPFETLVECQSSCESKIQEPSLKISDSVKQKIVQIKAALAAGVNNVSYLSDAQVQVSPEGNLLLEYHSATPIDETKKEDFRGVGNIVSESGDGNQDYFVAIWISHYQVEDTARLSWVSSVKPIVSKVQPNVP